MDTIHSLQVFESESHPNFHNQGPSKTEGARKKAFPYTDFSINLLGLHKGKISFEDGSYAPAETWTKYSSR